MAVARCMDDDTRFSVFLSNYNHGRFLPRALEAILAQSVQPREIYLVDDGSTDDSAKIIRRFAAQNPVIRPVFRERNQGFMANVLDWLRTVKDEYIYISAADDVVLPFLFAKSLAMLTRHPEAGLCSALSTLIDERGHDLGLFPSPLPSRTPCYLTTADVARFLLPHGGWFMGNTVIYRRAALAAAGGLDRKLKSFADGRLSFSAAKSCAAGS